MVKHKLRIDKRTEEFEGYGRMYLDEGLTPEVLDEYMTAAGWSDDPGTGQAVILPDGRELLNPIPVAPPASVLASTEPSVNDLVQRALQQHYAGLRASDEIDTLEEMDDFGEDDDFSPSSQYEVVVLRDEGPAIPRGAIDEEALQEVKALEEDAKKNAPPVKGE